MTKERPWSQLTITTLAIIAASVAIITASLAGIMFLRAPGPPEMAYEARCHAIIGEDWGRKDYVVLTASQHHCTIMNPDATSTKINWMPFRFDPFPTRPPIGYIP